MDQFGVLVESIGFKSQSRSTPLADLKGKTNINNGFSTNLGFDSKPPSNSGDGFGFGGGVFGSNSGLKTQDSNGFDDVFGGSNVYDFDSVFKGSNNSGAKSASVDDSDDIFGVFSVPKPSDSMNYDNVFGKIPPPPKRNDLNDDLLGGFSNIGSKPNGANDGSVYVSNNGSGFDDLIPGFEGRREKSERSSYWHSSDQDGKPNKILVEDPFDIFESPYLQRNNTSTQVPDPLNQGANKISVQSSIDELEEFATGRMRKDADKLSDTHFGGGQGNNMLKQKSVHREQKKIEIMRAEKRVEGERREPEDVDVLDSFFSNTRSRNVPNPSSVVKDSVYDALFQKSKDPEIQKSANPTTTKKVSPVINVDDDFSFLSGVEVVPPSGVFQEVKGESEERRRARYNHHQNTRERMIQALNEKNQRDRQVQLEQEERHRLAETLDDVIKRWASGKEGNLRALLSSLQNVLWPECGWRPVSLTDMITSISVKKVYQKATLCVHPDKVQQKGASIQQKYIAEKVFDVLKEAYNKFSSEEL